MKIGTQFIKRFLTPEMALLSCVEVILTFSLVLTLLTPATGSAGALSIHVALTSALAFVCVAFLIGLYRPQSFQRAGRLVWNTVLGALITFPAMWLIAKGSGISEYLPISYDAYRPLKIVAVWSAGVLGLRLMFLFAARYELFSHRVALVGGSFSQQSADTIKAYCSTFLKLVVVPPEFASASGLKERKFRTIVFGEANGTYLVPAIRAEYQRNGIAVLSQDDFFERHLRQVELSLYTSDQCRPETRISRAVSRAFDLIASLVLLIATLPIIVLVAALVWLDSGRPVLYRQERVGLNGKPFTLLKFRSMRTNAEASGPTWAQQRDPRVTRTGLFLRKTRIDELPQLWNILTGTMSFVGPRPERPHFVEQLKVLVPNYEDRTLVKPGLTGWAQVNFPYGASVEDARTKLSFDLYYVKNKSLLLDVLIVLSTVRVILSQDGAR